MNTQASLLTVTRELIPEDRRMDVVEGLFGTAFPLQLEPVVYGITDRMAGEHTGGYWHFYTLSDIARHYHLLGEYTVGHPEAGEILAATDCGRPVAPVATRRRPMPMKRMGRRRVVLKVFHFPSAPGDAGSEIKRETPVVSEALPYYSWTYVI